MSDSRGARGRGSTWLLEAIHSKAWEQPLKRPYFVSSPYEVRWWDRGKGLPRRFLKPGRFVWDGMILQRAFSAIYPFPSCHLYVFIGGKTPFLSPIHQGETSSHQFHRDCPSTPTTDRITVASVCISESRHGLDTEGTLPSKLPATTSTGRVIWRTIWVGLQVSGQCTTAH